MRNLLKLTARTPAGVPVSDPFAEVRVLKAWARLGVYTAIAAFTPIDLYVMAFSLVQTIYVQIASVAVATVAIEMIFRQSLKLRKRSAYPGAVVVEAGAAPSFSAAVTTALSLIQEMLNLRDAVFVQTPEDAAAIDALAAGSPGLSDWLRPHVAACRESLAPEVLHPPSEARAPGRPAGRQVAVLMPVVAFSGGMGVVVGLGGPAADLGDRELLRGIGHAMGLALENHRQREDIQAKEERLRAVITAAPIVLLRVDAEARFTLLEGKALERLGIEPERVLGRSVFQVFESLPNVVDAFRRALAGDTVRATAELGETVFEAELCPIRDADGNVTSIIGVATDITERKRAEDTIRQMAYHDALTGLPNRELFERTLSGCLAEAVLSGTLLAVLFVDLDGFKVVNDTVGHAEGDRCLKEMAARLTGLIRDQDFVARIGGDEFVVLLPEIRSLDEAMAISDRILSGLNGEWEGGGHRFRLSASMGVAVFPQDGVDCEVLLRSADRAMYEAKSRGKGRYAVSR